MTILLFHPVLTFERPQNAKVEKQLLTIYLRFQLILKSTTIIFFPRWDQRTRNYTQRFALKLLQTKLCIQSDGDIGEKKAGLKLAYCLKNTKGQSWYSTVKFELILSKLLCLDASKKIPRLMKCHELGGTQEWKMREDKNNITAIYNMAAGLCLVSQIIIQSYFPRFYQLFDNTFDVLL